LSRRARPAAWILCLAGILLGAAADRTPTRMPPTRGGFTVLAGDFHVHSFPGDGALAPWDIAHEARRRRLDVVALTNHNAMLSWQLAKAIGWTASGMLMIPGDEVTSVGFHVAAIGLERPVPWRGSIVDVAAAIHDQGGVAIGAHPVGPFRTSYHSDALRALDGIEAAHPEMFNSERTHLEFAEVYRDALAAHPGIAAIGSSDFHTWAPLGECRTYLFVRSATIDGVIDAIRAGRTVACDAKGVAYGPAALSSFVRDDCHADVSAPPAGEIGWLSRASATMTWLALVALVVVRPLP
jgi:PHP-associated